MKNLLKESRMSFQDLLCNFAEEEKDLESLRQNLCETPYFEPYLAFRRIDIANLGFLTTNNISTFLSNYNFFHNPSKIQCYINHYDQDFDQKLSYSEFLLSVLPQDNSELRFSISQRPIKKTEEFDPTTIQEIERKLAFLLNREIQFYIKFERQKRNLLKSVDYDIPGLFACLAFRNKDEIGYEDLKVFFMKNSYELNDNDIILMLRRIDLNGDGKIQINEFEDAFMPKNRYSNEKNKPTASRIRDKKEYYSNDNSLQNESKKTYDERKKQEDQQIVQKEYYSNGNILHKNYNKVVYDKKQYYSATNPNNLKFFKNKAMGEQIEEVMQLFDFFLKIERTYEDLKQELAMMDDFNLFDLFRVFDKTGKGHLLPAELEFAFNELQINPEKEEMIVFIQTINPKNEGKIKFSNFINAFLPKQAEYANILNKRQPRSEILTFNEIFKKKTRNLIKKVFETYFQNEMFLETVKTKLVRGPFFNMEKIFDCIDNDNDGFLSLHDLRRLFEKAGHVISEKQLLSLLERFDKDDDSFISFYEFDAEIQPKLNH